MTVGTEAPGEAAGKGTSRGDRGGGAGTGDAQSQDFGLVKLDPGKEPRGFYR